MGEKPQKKRTGRPTKAQGPKIRKPVDPTILPKKAKRGTSNSIEAREKNQNALLAAYARSGNMSRACLEAGIDRQSHYNWMHKYPPYQDKFLAIYQQLRDDAEDELYRRGVKGVDKPIIYQGQKMRDKNNDLETFKEYSDTALIAWLNANSPEKYRRRGEYGGDGPAPITFTLNLISPTQEQRNAQQATVVEAKRLTDVRHDAE